MALNRSALEWRGDRLHRVGQREPLLHIKRDACWPQMWRIEWPDGRLSDMANHTRIRDAAVLLVMAEINSEQQEGRSEATAQRAKRLAGCLDTSRRGKRASGVTPGG